MKRIEEMEVLYDQAKDVIEKMELMLDAYDGIQKDIQTLEAYYASGWIENYEQDERIPFPCKKGILSEDALYDLFERNDGIKKRIIK